LEASKSGNFCDRYAIFLLPRSRGRQPIGAARKIARAQWEIFPQCLDCAKLLLKIKVLLQI
jgi:hypothetical protein